MGSKCKECGELLLPPRQICSNCGSQNLEWYEFKGKGRIEAVTLNKAPSTPFLGHCPYAVGIVRLDEGPSISGFLNFEKPEKVVVGTRVEFKVLKDGEKTILAFNRL